MGGGGKERLQEVSLLQTIPYSDQQKWWSSRTCAVVTGGNRGIGFEITRQLAAQGLTVVLTSRDTDAGLRAVEALLEAGLEVVFHQLDIVDPSSVLEFANWIHETYGGLDILVNNAGVNFNIGSENSDESAEQVISTNYNGTKRMTEAMIPHMKPSPSGSRIVNVSSRLGRLSGRRNRISNVSLRERLGDVESLSEELIDNTVSTFLEQVKDRSWFTRGWPQMYTDYSVSKLAVNCYTRMMARELSGRPDHHKIYINCCCPGWVKTAMTGWNGNISAKDGADTAVWLALLPDQTAGGKFFAERREINF